MAYTASDYLSGKAKAQNTSANNGQTQTATHPTYYTASDYLSGKAKGAKIGQTTAPSTSMVGNSFSAALAKAQPVSMAGNSYSAALENAPKPSYLSQTMEGLGGFLTTGDSSKLAPLTDTIMQNRAEREYLSSLGYGNYTVDEYTKLQEQQRDAAQKNLDALYSKGTDSWTAEDYANQKAYKQQIEDYTKSYNDALSGAAFLDDTQKSRVAQLEEEQRALLDEQKKLSINYTAALDPISRDRVKEEQRRNQEALDAVRAELDSLDPSKTQYSGFERFKNSTIGTLKTAGAGMANAFWTLADAYGQGQANTMTADDAIFAMASGQNLDDYAKAKENQWSNEDTRAFVQKGYDAISEYNAKGQQEIAKSTQNASKAEKLLLDLYSGGLILAGDIAANAIAPGAGTALMATRAFGQGAMQARDAGGEMHEQLLYGAASAGLETLIEKISGLTPAYGKGTVDEIVERFISKVASKPGQIALRFLTSAGGEALEEFASAAIDPALRTIYTDKNIRAEYSDEELAEWLYQAFIGGVLGLAGAGVNPETYAYNTPNAPTAQTTPVQSEAAPAPAVEQTAAPEVQPTAEPTPIDIVMGILESGEVSKKQAETILNNSDLRDAFNSIPGVTPTTEVTGKSAQRGVIKAAAAKMAQSAETTQGDAEILPTAAETEAGQSGELNLPRETTAESAAQNTQPPTAIDPIEILTGVPAQTAAPVTEQQRPAPDTDARYATLGESNGTIPQGELAARSSAVPTVSGTGGNVSQTARTVYEAEATPESRLSDIRAAVVDGKLDYVPVNNEQLGNEASAKIQRDGWASSYVAWSEAVAKGQTSPQLIAMGAQLLNNAGNNPECSGTTYIDLLMKYRKLTSNTAQSLAATRLLKRLSPEGKLYAITKSIDAIRDAANGKYDVTIDESLIEKYRAQTTDEGRDAVITEIQKNIADQIPTTVLEALNALSYLNMLGNFKTQGRNLAGNAMSLIGRKIKDGVKQLLELGKAKENRTASFFYSKQLGAEAMADFENVRDEALGDTKYGDYGKEFDKGIQDQREIFKIRSDWGNTESSNIVQRGARKVADSALKVLEGYRTATQWAMETGDAIFARLAYADALAGYLQAKGIKSISEASPEVLEAARQYAIKQAQETTFRDHNILSDKAAKAAQGPIGKGVAPFRRTPANVLMRAIEYSPAGLITAGVQSAQEIKANKKGDTTGKDIVETWAKGLSGSALFALGFLLAKSGRLRTTEDDETLDDFQQMRGAQNWSYVFDDGSSITLDWLSPYSIPLFMGAALNDINGENLGLESFFKISRNVTGPLLEMSMLSGINDALESVSSWDDGAAVIQFCTNALLNLAARPFSNSLIRQAEQAWEDNRQTYYYDPESPLSRNTQYALSKLSASIPGWDYNTQDYIDAWGRTEDNGSWFDAFLNPAYTSKDNSTEVDAELERLYQYGKTKDEFPNVLPQKGDRSTTINGERLSPEEYEQYSIDRGQQSLKYVSDFMESAAYEAMSDEQRAKTISDLYAMANASAKKAVAESKGDTYVSDDWDDELILKDPVGYLAAKAQYSTAVKDEENRDYDAIDAMIDSFKSLNTENQAKLAEGNTAIKHLVALEGKVAAEPYFEAMDAKKAAEKAADSSADVVGLGGIRDADLTPEEEAAMVELLMGKTAASAYIAFTGTNHSIDDAIEFLGLTGSNKDGSASKPEQAAWVRSNYGSDFDKIWRIIYPPK